MIKHTLEISQRPARISLSKKQLVLHLEDETKRSFSCEDIGVIVLQHPAISLSAAALNALLENGAVVVICDERHLPSGILLPTVSHTELVPRMMQQLQSSEPARKQAWKQLVQAKIRAQAKLLTDAPKTKLLRLSEKVKSGDPENNEAQAAQIYWRNYFADQYASQDKRDPNSTSLFNALLNYGYAIIRAATARALVSSGLQPALGVFHHRRDNPFCLADDVMEPLRPLVDRTVKQILSQQNEPIPTEVLPSEHRKQLLQLLSQPVQWKDTTGPLLAVLPRYINSFYRLLTKESATLHSPSY